MSELRLLAAGTDQPAPPLGVPVSHLLLPWTLCSPQPAAPVSASGLLVVIWHLVLSAPREGLPGELNGVDDIP